MNKEPIIINTDDRDFFAVSVRDHGDNCIPVVVRSHGRIGARPLETRAVVSREAFVSDLHLPNWPGFDFGPDIDGGHVSGDPLLIEHAKRWLLSGKG